MHGRMRGARARLCLCVSVVVQAFTNFVQVYLCFRARDCVLLAFLICSIPSPFTLPPLLLIPPPFLAPSFPPFPHLFFPHLYILIDLQPFTPASPHAGVSRRPTGTCRYRGDVVMASSTLGSDVSFLAIILLAFLRSRERNVQEGNEYPHPSRIRFRILFTVS
ncbi:hypothetical protein C8R44DRAFT_803903 [Mycena epipterygia]|nr:hypothetical protein C8R44DRAFT_803903 [Mycena epipterygia]